MTSLTMLVFPSRLASSPDAKISTLALVSMLVLSNHIPRLRTSSIVSSKTTTVMDQTTNMSQTWITPHCAALLSQLMRLPWLSRLESESAATLLVTPWDLESPTQIAIALCKLSLKPAVASMATSRALSTLLTACRRKFRPSLSTTTSCSRKVIASFRPVA